MQKLRKQVKAIEDELIQTRRELHRCPEAGLAEFKTVDIICRSLQEMGVEYVRQEGQTAIVGIIRGAQEGNGKTVALRADMDGLPITEANEVSYASENAGWMHACGHDAHVAILLGTAKVLRTYAPRLRGNVKLLFQPAEETVGGAEAMVKLGCMENVDAVFGLHMDPLLPCSAVQTRYGALNGASDALHFCVRGRSAHGAYPDAGVDAIVVTAHLITALQTLISRNVSPLDSAVLSIGTIYGGTAENVLAAEVHMGGTLRTISPATRMKVKEQIRKTVKSVCAAFGAQGEVTMEEGYKALINNSAMVDLVLDTAKRLLGNDCVSIKEHPSLGVEDFSCFLTKAPGAFFHLGCRNEQKGIASALHTNTFDIDEDSLEAGVLMETALALRILNEDLLDEETLV